MTYSLHITYPEIGDIEKIIELFEVTWMATYPNEVHGITLQDIEDKNNATPREQKIANFTTYIETEKDNPDRFYRVAKSGDRVVGVCGALIKDDVVHMASLYVMPTEQRKGTGGQLMQSFMKWANTKNLPIRLHVVTYNQPAIDFYEKWGFKDNGKRFTEERYKMTSGNYLPEMEMVYTPKQ